LKTGAGNALFEGSSRAGSSRRAARLASTECPDRSFG
jgi:hypothetical protein